MHVSDVTGTDIETTTKDEPKTVTRYDTRTVLWTAGVEAVPFVRTLADALGVEQDRSGRIAVEEDLSVPGHRNIWVAGDMMSLNGLSGVAEVAMRGGRHVGALIAADVADPGAARAPFTYRDLGSAAYIARGHALVQAGPLRMSGLLGWLSWGVIHIAFLSGNRIRVGTLVNWAATLATNSAGYAPSRSVTPRPPARRTPEVSGDPIWCRRPSDTIAMQSPL